MGWDGECAALLALILSLVAINTKLFLFSVFSFYIFIINYIFHHSKSCLSVLVEAPALSGVVGTCTVSVGASIPVGLKSMVLVWEVKLLRRVCTIRNEHPKLLMAEAVSMWHLQPFEGRRSSPTIQC